MQGPSAKVTLDGETFWKLRAVLADAVSAELNLRMATAAHARAIQQRTEFLATLGIPATVADLEWNEQTRDVSYALPMTRIMVQEPPAE